MGVRGRKLVGGVKTELGGKGAGEREREREGERERERWAEEAGVSPGLVSIAKRERGRERETDTW